MNRTDVKLLLRARAKSLVVLTTGTMALQATATGYRRATGSFITDGFLIGMEVQPSGFTKNTSAGVIEDVTATDLTITGGCTAQASASGRALSVGLPAFQRWAINLQDEPPNDAWYVEEESIPTPKLLRGLTRGGVVANEGLYLLRLWGIPDTGDEPLEKVGQALEDHFHPGILLGSLPSGEPVHIRGDPMPWSSDIRQDDRHRPFCTVTIPWRCDSNNLTTS